MDSNDFGKKEEALFGISSEKLPVPEEPEKPEYSLGEDERSAEPVEKREKDVDLGVAEKLEETPMEWEKAKDGDAYPTVRGTFQGHEIYLGRSDGKFYGTLDGARVPNDVAEKTYRKLLEKKLVATHAQRYNVRPPERRHVPRQDNGPEQETSQDGGDQAKVNEILAKMLLK